MDLFSVLAELKMTRNILFEGSHHEKAEKGVQCESDLLRKSGPIGEGCERLFLGRSMEF